MATEHNWTRVLVPDDGRAKTGRGTNTVYAFPRYSNRESWETRAEHLRRRILVSAGLWPMPEKTPLRPQITGRIEHDEYVIENVYLESLPGFLVTGNLYRPVGKTGPYPAVVCPHGHWPEGRLEDSEDGSVPGRCISFARQGYIGFAYDMIGYNDSGLQVPHRQPASYTSGFFDDATSYLWGISLTGLQLWNSIRVLDFLVSLPDVDPSRIACTGASGGGTQTFLLTAVEHVAINFGKPNQEELEDLTADEAERLADEGQFGKGSMEPKVRAAIKFARSRKGRTCIIGALDKAAETMAGLSGTRIHE